MPLEAQSMTIADLLMSQRRWGVTRCRKLLQYVPMSETKEIGSMTTRQRNALSELLKRAAPSAMSSRATPLRPERRLAELASRGGGASSLPHPRHIRPPRATSRRASGRRTTRAARGRPFA